MIDFSQTNEKRLSERKMLIGGQVRLFFLGEGDSIEIIDVEGSQPCSIFAFKDNESSLNALSLQPTKESIFDIEGDHAAAFEALSSTQSIDVKLLEESAFFNKKTSANSRKVLIAKWAVQCILVAAGKSMSVSESDPPTGIETRIFRTDENRMLSPEVPEPLAQPLVDVRIESATAHAYKVKAGQYIQIIDVEGQQCADFQAFAQSDVNNGNDFAIDPTVTRTFMGSCYPHPGLFNKFYNANSVPLAEIIQDTVGRHDTFGLACNAKYYEDMGYPGHANCTDNFNNVLAKMNVPSRRNWATINLFFNTNVTDQSSIEADESWSRPGDFILIRALTDLVCVTSACPDDIDPANGWNPTDIHLRVYSEENNFAPATVFRSTPDAIPTMTKPTAFHEEFSKYTRNFSEYNGYWLAQDFTNYGAIKEYWACRERVAVMDLSPLRKFEIFGQDAEELMQYAITRNVKKLAVGQVVYSAICYENGGMIDDGTLFRLDENNFRWVCGNDYSGIWMRQLAKEKGLKTWVKTSTDQLHNLAVQGPNSRDLLKEIIWTPSTRTKIEELAWFHFSVGRIGGEQGIPIMVSRTGYTGELGYEIWCHPTHASNVWQAIWHAGQAFDIAPLGLNALDMLRIEAGLIFAGYEFCDQTNPFEAGIGFCVPLKTKEDDFIGKDALMQRKEHAERKLVGLELEGNEVAQHGEGVYIGRQQIGIITSGTRSPILRKNIALCKIDILSSETGTHVEVGKLDGHQKRLGAIVCPFPFYDPQKLKVRA